MAYNVISADSHIDIVWLPRDLFVSNAPAKLKDKMPRVVETEVGQQPGDGGLGCGRVPRTGKLGQRQRDLRVLDEPHGSGGPRDQRPAQEIDLAVDRPIASNPSPASARRTLAWNPSPHLSQDRAAERMHTVDTNRSRTARPVLAEHPARNRDQPSAPCSTVWSRIELWNGGKADWPSANSKACREGCRTCR